MPCFYPLSAWRSGQAYGGTSKITFDKNRGNPLLPLQLPCGQCIGCRLERSRQWAVRCIHEAKMHQDNCFITLTYDDQHLPEGHTLIMKDFQDFMKRLRKNIEPKKIRFFHCGEYGDQTSRPHYHACIFGYDFSDKKLWRSNEQQAQNKLYTSLALKSLWDKGHSTIGAVTFESAAYVARYVLKKINGPHATKHYEYIDRDTGELFDRAPEYVTMSRRPGIGATFYRKFHTDIFPSDEVITRGIPTKPPKFYDRQFEITNPIGYEEVKTQRKKNALIFKDNQTPERLKIREQCTIARTTKLKREL